MEATLEEITTMIRLDQIFGLSIDTCIFVQHKNRLENAWFARLSQFQYSAQLLYFPEIIKEEVISHMISDAEAAQKALNQSFAGVRKTWNIEEDVSPTLFSDTAAQMARRRFEEFEERTGARILVNSTNVDQVFNDYFASKPPFEKLEAKKHEFPDAFALQSLSELCVSKDSKLLIVSTDKGWQAYCKSDPNLICLNNFGEALSCFQDQNAFFAAQILSDAFSRSAVPHLEAQIERHFDNNLHECEFSLDAESHTFRVDYNLLETKIQKFEVSLEGSNTFAAIDFVDNELTAQCTASATILANFELQFFVFDSEDKTDFLLASQLSTFTTQQDFEMLVTFDMPDFLDVLPGKTSVISVDNKDRTIYFEGGQVEPDFGPDY